MLDEVYAEEYNFSDEHASSMKMAKIFSGRR
jgi:hypothetical protein